MLRPATFKSEQLAAQLGLVFHVTVALSLFTACSNERATFDEHGRTERTQSDAGARGPEGAEDWALDRATDGGEPAAAQSEGLLPPGPLASGPQPTDPQPTDPLASGANSPGSNSAGSNSPGSNSLGSNSAGPEPIASTTAGPSGVNSEAPSAAAPLASTSPSVTTPSQPSSNTTSDSPPATAPSTSTAESPLGAGGSNDDPDPDSSDAANENEPPSESGSEPETSEPDTDACNDEACAEDAAPTIVNQVPANGAKGVEADQEVVLTFSKPMDQDSVGSALTISGVSANARTLEWDDAGRVLTIVPDEPFVYSTGVLVDSEARSYTVSVGIAARDLDGNRLAGPYTASFTTLRDLQVRISPKQAGQLSSGAAANGSAPSLCTGDADLYVGWTGTNAAKDTTYIFAQFDPSELGSADSITEFKSATFFARHGTPTANYYATGSVNFDSVSFGPMDSSLISRSVRDTQLLAESTEPYNPSADVSEGFLSSWEAGDPLLYRLSPKDSTADERAVFECYGMFIEIEYLAP